MSVWAINIIQEMQEDVQSQFSKSAKHQVILGLKISFKGQEVWTAWLLKFGPIGRPEMSVSTNLRYVTSQECEELHYTAAESWNHDAIVAQMTYVVSFVVAWLQQLQRRKWRKC